MKISKFDNPIFVFFLCLLCLSVNIISSIYFSPILLVGILYIAFFVCLKNRYLNSLFFIILTMLSIEVNNGFMPFSLIMLSFFTYAFIIPYLRRVLSIENIKFYIYIFIFYFEIYILWIINNDNTAQLTYTIIINLLIDFIIFGVFI